MVYFTLIFLYFELYVFCSFRKMVCELYNKKQQHSCFYCVGKNLNELFLEVTQKGLEISPFADLVRSQLGTFPIGLLIAPRVMRNSERWL